MLYWCAYVCYRSMLNPYAILICVCMLQISASQQASAEPGWIIGRKDNNLEGCFPAAYVQLQQQTGATTTTLSAGLDMSQRTTGDNIYDTLSRSDRVVDDGCVGCTTLLPYTSCMHDLHTLTQWSSSRWWVRRVYNTPSLYILHACSSFTSICNIFVNFNNGIYDNTRK